MIARGDMSKSIASRLKPHARRAIIGGSRLSGALALSRHLTRHGFNIVGFHGVSIQDEHLRFPTLFISPESFERRLQFITRHYQVVGLPEIVEQHRTGRIRPRQVVLTFDDGFYNFSSRAVPLLKKYGVTATVYVVTAEIEAGDPVFNLLARDIVLSTRHGQVRDLPHLPEVYDLSTAAGRRKMESAVVRALRGIEEGEGALEFCRRLARQLDVDIEQRLTDRVWHRLTPGEVRGVIRDGFDVQLHTHSHRNVVENRAVVREEVRRNREALERITGQKAQHFCYPLGLWAKDVWDDLRAEGVVSAVTTKNGPNFAQTPALSLRRYLTGEAMNAAEFEFGLSGIQWLLRATVGSADRYAPREKRLRYSEQPDLY